MIRISTRVAAVLFGILLVWAGLSVQPSLAQAPAGGTLALTGARVIDGTGAPPLEGATIVKSAPSLGGCCSPTRKLVPAGLTPNE